MTADPANPNKAHEAVAKASAERAAACQAVLGDAERVTWATDGFEGPNPVLRILSFGAIALPLVLLLVLPVPVVIGLALAVAVAVFVAGGKVWSPRTVAVTDHGVVVFARGAKGALGTVIGRTATTEPTQSKDVWRGYEVDGGTTWVSKLALDARDAATATA